MATTSSSISMASSASTDEINPHLIPVKKDPEMIRMEVFLIYTTK